MAASLAGYEAYLLGLPRYSQMGNEAMKPGIRGIGHLMDAMGHPERELTCVHVAGTNGKGSTASMIAAIAQSAGLRTGLFTSPHLVRMAERIRIDGRPVEDGFLGRTVERHKAAFERLQPSFFEAITALAFACFTEADVDLAVVETGLGGRLDATNIIRPAVSVVTQIALDHQSTLGHTLAQIAREKGGIIKPGIPVVAKPQCQETGDVLRSIADRQSAPWHDAGQIDYNGEVLDLHTAVRTYSNVICGVSGRHQHLNALLAVRASELLIEDLAQDSACAFAGLANVTTLAGLRGRLECLREHPRVVLDVAHNPSSIAAALDHSRGGGALRVVLSLMSDKDTDSIAKLLSHRATMVYTCDIDSPRAWGASVLARQLAHRGVTIGGSGTLEDTWQMVESVTKPSDTTLICGSHYLAGAFLAKNATGQVALCV